MLTQIALMTSGSAAGAAKSVTTLALEAPRNDWLRAGDFHDVQGTLTSPSTGRIHACSRISLALRENASCYLQGESIQALLDDDSATESPLWNVGGVVPFRVKHLPNTTNGLIVGSSREPTAPVSQPPCLFAPPDA